MLDQRELELLDHSSRLLFMHTGSDTQVHIGARYFEFIEENVGHRWVVVLPCVDDQAFDLRAGVMRSRNCARNRRKFDELRPCANDVHDTPGTGLRGVSPR